jgi:hypothetical protein
MLIGPSPFTSEVTSTSYQLPAEVLLSEAKLAASAAGALFQLTVPSLQLLSATR